MFPTKKKISPMMIMTGIILVIVTFPLAAYVVKNSTEIRSMAKGNQKAIYKIESNKVQKQIADYNYAQKESGNTSTTVGAGTPIPAVDTTQSYGDCISQNHGDANMCQGSKPPSTPVLVVNPVPAKSSDQNVDSSLGLDKLTYGVTKAPVPSMNIPVINTTTAYSDCISQNHGETNMCEGSKPPSTPVLVVNPVPTKSVVPTSAYTNTTGGVGYSSEGFVGGSDTRNVQLGSNSYYGAIGDGNYNFTAPTPLPGGSGTTSYVYAPGKTDKTAAPIGVVVTTRSKDSKGNQIDQTTITANGKTVATNVVVNSVALDSSVPGAGATVPPAVQNGCTNVGTGCIVGGSGGACRASTGRSGVAQGVCVAVTPAPSVTPAPLVTPVPIAAAIPLVTGALKPTGADCTSNTECGSGKCGRASHVSGAEAANSQHKGNFCQPSSAELQHATLVEGAVVGGALTLAVGAEAIPAVLEAGSAAYTALGQAAAVQMSASLAEAPALGTIIHGATIAITAAATVSCMASGNASSDDCAQIAAGIIDPAEVASGLTENVESVGNAVKPIAQQLASTAVEKAGLDIFINPADEVALTDVTNLDAAPKALEDVSTEVPKVDPVIGAATDIANTHLYTYTASQNPIPLSPSIPLNNSNIVNTGSQITNSSPTNLVNNGIQITNGNPSTIVNNGVNITSINPATLYAIVTTTVPD